MAIANITNNILTDSGTLISSLATSATTISTTSPLQGGGDLSANRTLSITQSGTASNGYLSSADWNTFNGKGSGTVTSVAALTIGTSGTDLSSTVANSTTTPVITLNVPTASATNRGALSSADWTTFNNKQNALTNPVLASGTWTSGYLPKINGTYTIGNSIIQDLGYAYILPSGAEALRVANDNVFLSFYNSSNTTRRGYIQAQSTALTIAAEGSFMQFQTPSGNMRLDASGNLGLGVTPSAWASGYTALQVPSGTYGGGSFFSDNGSPAISANAYNNAGWKYVNTDYATIYQSRSGQHQWFTAPSGTAGNAISFTQAMTLTASGRLLIGTPTEASYLLDVNGTGRFSGALTGTIATFIDPTNNSPLNWSRTGGPKGYLYSDGDNIGITNVLDFGAGYEGILLSTSANAINFYTNGVSTPRLTISSSGAATFSSSVASSISGSGDNAFLLATGTGTGARYSYIANDGAAAIFGIEKAAGGAILGGSSAYATVLYSNNATPLQLGTNQLVRMTITSSGNVGIGTTSPDVTGFGYTTLTIKGGTTSGYAGVLELQTAITNANGQNVGIMAFLDGTSRNAQIGVQRATSTSTADMMFYTNAGAGIVERMRITSGGNVLLQSNNVLGLNTSDGSDNGYLAIAGAGADGATRGGHIYLSGNERSVDAGSVVIATGNTTSGTGATAETVFRNAGNESMRITSGGNVEIASGSIKTGTPSGGTAKPWKLGQDTSTLYSATRTIQVEIDGGTYYLLAVKSTDL